MSFSFKNDIILFCIHLTFTYFLNIHLETQIFEWQTEIMEILRHVKMMSFFLVLILTVLLPSNSTCNNDGIRGHFIVVYCKYSLLRRVWKLKSYHLSFQNILNNLNCCIRFERRPQCYNTLCIL